LALEAQLLNKSIVLADSRRELRQLSHALLALLFQSSHQSAKATFEQHFDESFKAELRPLFSPSVMKTLYSVPGIQRHDLCCVTSSARVFTHEHKMLGTRADIEVERSSVKFEGGTYKVRWDNGGSPGDCKSMAITQVFPSGWVQLDNGSWFQDPLAISTEKFELDNQTQVFVVPFSGKYRLTAVGASGGTDCSGCFRPGQGRVVSVRIDLREGEELLIRGGRRGAWGTSDRGGGAATGIERLKTASPSPSLEEEEEEEEEEEQGVGLMNLRYAGNQLETLVVAGGGGGVVHPSCSGPCHLGILALFFQPIVNLWGQGRSGRAVAAETETPQHAGRRCCDPNETGGRGWFKDDPTRGFGGHNNGPNGEYRLGGGGGWRGGDSAFAFAYFCGFGGQGGTSFASDLVELEIDEPGAPTFSTGPCSCSSQRPKFDGADEDNCCGYQNMSMNGTVFVQLLQRQGARNPALAFEEGLLDNLPLGDPVGEAEVMSSSRKGVIRP
jgi:hypothetical protein